MPNIDPSETQIEKSASSALLSPELMAPVGSWEALHAAIEAKADSIFFGLEGLNMRSNSSYNFTLDDLDEIVKICKKNKVKTYVTLNSIIYDEDIPLMKELCVAIQKRGADAVIACDMAVMQYAKSIGLDVHISTQANVCNIEAVRFFSKFSDVMVLARELSLEQIRSIGERIEKEEIRGPSGKLVEIEIFVHGAFCISVSGKCHMSLLTLNSSANRGQCVQNCRRKYRVIDEQTNQELMLENHHVMSPKDLCTIEFLDQILASKVKVLKIEGRGRSAEYVSTVVSTYKQAIEAIQNDTYTPENIALWKAKLSTVYNRGFWDGYYLGRNVAEWSGNPGSQATRYKTYVGKIAKYYPKIQVAEALIESASLELGNEFLVTGTKTGVVEGKVESLHTDKPVKIAEKGVLVAFPISKPVRKNDKLYIYCQRK